jgi:hypothetical protein
MMCKAIKHSACLIATTGDARALRARHAARGVRPQIMGTAEPNVVEARQSVPPCLTVLCTVKYTSGYLQSASD